MSARRCWLVQLYIKMGNKKTEREGGGVGAKYQYHVDNIAMLSRRKTRAAKVVVMI